MSDQLFRREFIDPKMPGYKSDPAEVRVGKDLVLRLKSLAQQAAGTAAASGTRRAASPLSPNSHGIPDAV
jgi:hypothetical protein